MDPARFERSQTLFHRIVDLPADECRRVLDEECGDDTALREGVLAMLEEDHRASWLDTSVGRAASRLLESAASSVDEIGPYQVLQVIGEGGMGVVHLARRTDLGTLAAIKILRDAWLSPERRDRFRTEQRTLARLSHPGIARLFDAGTLADGTPWIVMEYVDGKPLNQYARDQALTIRARLSLLRAVAEAVQHAHRHLVVHRDLKPTNVLVTDDGTVKLLDFGIAKEMEEAGSLPNRTRTLIRLMTPAYAAPEQVRGEGVGLYTDVYGLGAMLYQLLTGLAPFDFSARSTAESERMLLEEDPRRPSLAMAEAASSAERPPDALTIGASTWADLDVLCLTAMHKDPVRRYPTVEAFLRDLDHFANGEPLEARPDAFSYRARKFMARNWRPLVAAAASLVLLTALVTFYTLRVARARNEAITEATRAQRVKALLLDILSGGEDGTAPADYLRVVDVLDRGVVAAESISNEPVVQAELFQTLGSVYGELGRFKDAESLVTKAVDRSRELFGADSLRVAEGLTALGLIRIEQSQLEEAERLTREGLAMTRRHAAPADPAVPRALTAVGRVLEERGGYPEAIQILEEAVSLETARGSASADLATSLRHLGNVHFYAGHLDQAGALFARVLAMTRQVGGARHALVADDLINIGAVHFEQGQFTEAERYYREALPITEGWYGKDHNRTASNLTMLGRALVAQRRFDDAVPLLDRAVAIQERVFGKVHPRVASAVNELGIVALQRSRYDDAEAAFTRMADIYRAIYPGKHYLTATAIANLASVAIKKQDFRRAELLGREAVDLYASTQGPEHVNTGIARLKLGRALAGQGRFAEGEAETVRGYDIIVKQSVPPASWLKAAREDLVKAYVALKRPDMAERYRAELATAGNGK
jgi:serine/threonine-protein kinase